MFSKWVRLVIFYKYGVRGSERRKGLAWRDGVTTGYDWARLEILRRRNRDFPARPPQQHDGGRARCQQHVAGDWLHISNALAFHLADLSTKHLRGKTYGNVLVASRYGLFESR
jgi:hypothetical protein